MGKFLLGLVTIVIVAIVAFNLFGTTLFAKVVGDAVGAPVKVGEVRLDLFGSRVRVQDLKIGNPGGFEEKTLASIPEILIAYDLKSLTSGKLRFPLIVLNL